MSPSGHNPIQVHITPDLTLDADFDQVRANEFTKALYRCASEYIETHPDLTPAEATEGIIKLLVGHTAENRVRSQPPHFIAACLTGRVFGRYMQAHDFAVKFEAQQGISG